MADTKRIKAPRRLGTERLILRRVSKRDIPFLLELFGRQETLKFVREEPLRTIAEAERFYETDMRMVPTRFRLVAVLKKTGEPIGTLGLFRHSAENNSAHIGYDLLKEHWGRGYMSEAARALLEYGLTEAGLNRIQGNADMRNTASLRLMESIGMQRELVMRQVTHFKGAFRDIAFYSYLKDDLARENSGRKCNAEPGKSPDARGRRRW